MIYLTYSGDDQKPYTFTKIITIIGESLKLKCHPDRLEHHPFSYNPSKLQTAIYIDISIDMFMAWSPPMFPIELIEEEVTTEELDHECV